MPQHSNLEVLEQADEGDLLDDLSEPGRDDYKFLGRAYLATGTSQDSGYNHG